MITISWHLLLVIVLQLIIIGWCICKMIQDSSTGGYLAGLGGGLAFIASIILSALLWVIYGGIVWW